MNEHVKRVVATVEKNVALGPGVHELTFRATGDTAWAGAQPGQFAMVRCPGDEPLLGRPLAFLTADGERASFGIKVYGRGSAAIVAAPVGTPMVMWGPLGKGFSSEPSESFVLAGGGIGVPPLVMHAARLVREKRDLRAVIVGARTKAELFGRAQLDAIGISAKICTDDGSEGHKGFVTALLEREPLGEGTVVQSCGPTPMMTAVAKIAAAAGARCELSLEARMGCGVGACRGCMIPVSDSAKGPGGHFQGREYLCLCLDGPVVSPGDIDFVKLGAIH